MNKKTSLSAALHEASGKKPVQVLPVIDIPTPSQQGDLPPSRRGKKIIAGYFDPAVTRQLKQLALDNDATLQSLLAEALNDLFTKHGKQPLA